MKSRTVLSLFRLSYERTLTSEFFCKLAKVFRVRHAGKAALTVKTKFENKKNRVAKYVLQIPDLLYYLFNFFRKPVTLS